MTSEQREEFWRRFRIHIEYFSTHSVGCDVTLNPFDIRRWDAKFSKRLVTHPDTSVTLTIVEHGTSNDEFLLAVTATARVGDVESVGNRMLIPVFFDPSLDAFSLHADHGPVSEHQMPAYFSRLLETFARQW